MARKETFATSGPRMKLRFFAGAYDNGILQRPNMLETAYDKGVPMGGTLVGEQKAPNFIAWAVQDPLRGRRRACGWSLQNCRSAA